MLKSNYQFFFIFFYQILYALKASHFVSTHIKQYSFFYFSCCISSWLHTCSSSPYTSPWNVTTPTPWNDATTPRSSATPWSLTISSSTSWSNATTGRNTTTSWSTTPWGPTWQDARSPRGRKSTTTNCWKILMKQVTQKRNYVILPKSGYVKNYYSVDYKMS